MSPPGVVFGGPSPEHDVSILTGLQAARALSKAGQPPVAVFWDKTAKFWWVDPDLEAEAFIDGAPKGAVPLRLGAAHDGGGFAVAKGGLLSKGKRLDVGPLVNCCHGGPGEDGTLQASLDIAGLRYSGPSAAGAALGMDKLAFGAVVGAAGLPSLPRVLVTPSAAAPIFPGPYILKPRFGGSSIGIEVVNAWDDALALVGQGSVHWRRGALAEPYRANAIDINVAVRAYPSVQLSLLEHPLRSGGHILGYRDKYLGGDGMASAPRQLPAELEPGLADALRDAARAVIDLAAVRGVARLDFLVEGQEWWVNEINTIPGSLARYLWVGESAVEFPTLLGDLIAEATSRPAFRWDASGADGLALRSASSIASKLG